MKTTKRFYLASVLALFFFVQSISGQVKLGVYTGLGLSSFELQGSSAEGIPIGLQATYSLESIPFISFNFGLDFSYTASPFTFRITNASGVELFRREQNQLHIGALVKVKFATEFFINPYVRIGTGLYSGSHSITFVDEIIKEAQQQQISLPEELDVSSNFGFNLGGGLDLKLNSTGKLALFLEFVYHLNNREIDESSLNILQGFNLQKEDAGFDNLAILLGFQIGF